MPDGRHPIGPSPMRRAIARWMVESKTHALHIRADAVEAFAAAAAAARASAALRVDDLRPL